MRKSKNANAAMPGAKVIRQPIVTPAPLPGQLLVRHGAVAGEPGNIVTAANRWRESYNPLRWLTMRRAVELLELGQRGDYAYLQWAYHFCERRNSTLSGLVSRCEAPLMSMDWSIRTTAMVPQGMSRDAARKKARAMNRGAKLAPAGADDLDAEQFKAMAEAQKRTLEAAYNAIGNLRSSILHLHKADFRGYAHVQKHRNADGDVVHLETLDQWCICRDGLNGNWFWNPDSRSTSEPMDFLGINYCIGGPALPLADFIIREVARPIDEIGLVNTVRRGMVEKNWDGFIEVYGIPSGIVIMPPAPVGMEQQYLESARKISEGGSGALPTGSDYKANTAPAAHDPFTPRLDALEAQLVLAGTGGKLTMLVEHSAGESRGSSRVHDETFSEIANGRAQSIAELFQEDLDAEILAREHAGEPALCYFYFGGEEAMDINALCANALALKNAGKTVNAAWFEEKSGYQLDEDDDGNPNLPDPTLNAPSQVEPGQAAQAAPTEVVQSEGTKVKNRSGVDDVAAEVQAALAPVLVRMRKIRGITDMDSRLAALEKLAADFPVLRDVVLADHGVSRAVASDLLDSLQDAPVAARSVPAADTVESSLHKPLHGVQQSSRSEDGNGIGRGGAAAPPHRKDEQSK